MTTLNIADKYSPGKRIDHENFGDVRKTTFAKGTISDFKVDDPNDLVDTIYSRVKVKVSGNESDWLPLFYHPRAKYWDSGTLKALDYNKDGQYFERGWMSFRCDDEVAVMLKEGVPAAVVGFADGVPRIGENILKSKLVGHGWDTAGKTLYTNGDKGPDNIGLGLLLKADKFIASSVSNPEQVMGGAGADTVHRWCVLDSRETIYYPDASPPQDKIVVVMSIHQTDEHSPNYLRKYIVTGSNYLVPIGPILYWIQQGTGLYTYRWANRVLYTQEVQYISNNWTRHTYGSPEHDYPEAEGYADAWIASHVYDETVVYPGVTLPTTNGSSSLQQVGHALYSDKLYNKAEKAKDMPTDFINDLPMYNLLNFDTAVIPGSPPVWPPVGSLAAALASVTSDVDLQFYAHPHTKSELQAAGMWPS